MTEDRVFKLKLPMRMKINKHGEQESLNLNIYRNLHYYKLNYQKKAFKDFVKPLLRGLPSMEAVTLHYEINPKGGSRLDTMNVGSVVDKFLSDALVEFGIIPDDDYKHVVGISFSFGTLCPEQPHVLVTITETKPRKETPMRILLDQNEIQQALEAFVQTMGLPGASGVELTVNGDEVQAEIIMNGVISGSVNIPSSSNTETSDQPKRRGGRVLGSKNKPKEITNVAADSSTRNALFGSGDSESGEGEDQDSDTETDSDSEGSDVDIVGESSSSSDEEADGTGSEEPTSGSKSTRKNLFGDSDNESSEDTSPDNSDSNSNEEAPVKTTGKRPSIFDAD